MQFGSRYQVCIVGGYSLDLYCVNADGTCNENGRDGAGHIYNEFPHQFYGQTNRECMKEAKQRGWVINKQDDVAICPFCRSKNKR